jgi:hypothetical protein
LAVATVGGAMATMLEGPWAIGGAIAAIVAAGIVIVSAGYEFILQPIWRRRKLKKPCEMWFAIPSLAQRKIDYAVQDLREHNVEELTLAANSQFEIEVLYRPIIGFVASEIYFGCDSQDYRHIETKPIIKSFCSRFIERGTNEESPETHPDTNYADRHKYYHIRKQRNAARHEIYSIGFKIQTREVGRYEFKLFFIGEEVGSANRLFIRVEDRAVTRMRCVHRDHRWTGCFIQPVGPS